MFLLWTTKAEADLIRLHEFLDPVNPDAAARVVQQLVAAAGTLLIHPHLGRSMTQVLPDEVRRLIVGDYEMRYLVTKESLTILRLWHTREDR